jgi:hypothetical protein
MMQGSGVSGLLMLVLGLLATPGNAADLGEQNTTVSQPPRYSEQFEARAGVFAHGVGSIERNTVDINLELVAPRLPLGSTEWWAKFIPRPNVGGFLNTDHRTSNGYAGVLWTLPIDERLFLEPFFGAAVHNGLRDGSETRSALGCQFGFNFGSSIGYRIDGPWSVIATYNHMSNGNSSVGTNCPHNKGVNNIGVKFGYSF